MQQAFERMRASSEQAGASAMANQIRMLDPFQKTAVAAQRTAKSVAGVAAVASAATLPTRQLATGFASLASQMVGVSPVFGRIALALGGMAAGGGIVLAATAGISAIAFAYSKMKGAAEEAKKANEDFVASLSGLVNAADMIGLTERAREIERGRPSDGAAGFARDVPGSPVFKGSLLDMRAERDSLSSQKNLGGTVISGNRKRIAELDRKITQAETQLREVTNRLTNPLTTPPISPLVATINAKRDKKPLTGEQQFSKLTGSMRDLLALQGAMKEAEMSTLSVDNQIFAAYQRINDEIARGVRLTTEQLAAAIRLKTELGAAMAPMPGGVGMTPMAGGNPTAGIKVKGSNLFDSKDQYGNPIQGQFNVPGAGPKPRSFGSKVKGFFSGPQNGDSMGTRVGQVLQAGGGGGEMGQMVQAFASFGPMAVLLPVINGAMEKLGPAFEKLITPLVEFGASIGEMLIPVFEMLAPVVDLVVASFKVFQPVLKFVLKGFSYFMQGLGMVIKGIGKLIDALPFVKAKGIIRAGEEMIEAAKAARRNADATDEATDAVEKFAGALSNIPRVLNVNALRHMVTGGGGGQYAPPSGPTFNGGITINVNGAGDPRRVAEEVGRAIERTRTRGGVSRLQVALA